MGCYNNEVLFIHIPKCAGWTIKQYMREHLQGVLLPDDPQSKLPIAADTNAQLSLPFLIG